MNMDKGVTVRSVAKLEECGLIYRIINKSDRRINCVFPTQAALAQRDELLAITARLQELLFRGFTFEEREQAPAFITRMRNNIESEFEQRYEF